MRERGPRAAGTDVCGPCDLLATGDLKSLHTNIHGPGEGIDHSQDIGDFAVGGWGSF